ncbi:LysO family transporter [Salmonella enterica]|uniref:LysO family transporter n=1 Tax=Salmonella enterica TaxID=28901 RepID=UPI001E30F636|nr:LysO family transporter [Salmonella enterica]
MISSGFGWFSLSGPMVNKLVSTEMGAMAFMTDFFREMFSIIFSLFFGSDTTEKCYRHIWGSSF